MKWYKETKQESSRATNGLKNHWKKFIPRISFDDLMRSIRAFLGVVQICSNASSRITPHSKEHVPG